MASLSKDPTLPFRLIFGRCFFCDSVFRRPVPAGGRVVWRVLSGGAASPSYLLGGAAWPPPLGVAALPLSSVGWWCLPSPPSGRAAFPPAPLRPFFSPKKIWEPAAPKGGGGGRQHDLEGGGQSAPPAREGRESSTTEREEEGPPLN